MCVSKGEHLPAHWSWTKKQPHFMGQLPEPGLWQCQCHDGTQRSVCLCEGQTQCLPVWILSSHGPQQWEEGRCNLTLMETALIDIFYYFNKSTDRKQHFKGTQEAYSVDQHKILKHICTCWLSIGRWVVIINHSSWRWFLFSWKRLHIFMALLQSSMFFGYKYELTYFLHIVRA